MESRRLHLGTLERTLSASDCFSPPSPESVATDSAINSISELCGGYRDSNKNIAKTYLHMSIFKANFVYGCNSYLPLVMTEKWSLMHFSSVLRGPKSSRSFLYLKKTTDFAVLHALQLVHNIANAIHHTLKRKFIILA